MHQQRPDATLPDGTTQTRRETLEYNTDGRITAHTTGAGHRHEFTYSVSGAALRRVLDFYAHTANAAERVLNPESAD